MPQWTPFPQSSPATDTAPPHGDGPGHAPAGPSGEPERPSVFDTPPDLPGCESFPMTLREFERSDERLEFWDARRETAWKLRDYVTVYHEQPLSRLAVLASRIASVRGSPIECCGSVSLTMHEATGRYRWVMQPDQLVYLDWARSRPSGRVIRVEEDTLPDVVLEVDHTTDVRRWKLKLYQECGFPELWVSVPHETSVRKPGLAIHLREGDGYRVSEESRAFPGWRVEEIHRALTESRLSTRSWRALERVGRAMGAREGTRPDDDPLTRSLTANARTEGRSEGFTEGRSEGFTEGRTEGFAEGRSGGFTDGRSEGCAEGRLEGRASGCRAGRLAERVEAVRELLRSRGIEPAAGFAEEPELLAAPPLEAVLAAALACTDETDFRRRLRDHSAPPPP